MEVKVGDIYTTYHKKLGCYIACQITDISEKTITKLELNWTGTEPLNKNQLKNLQPLYKDFMYWEKSLCLINVEKEIPEELQYVGNISPIITKKSNTYGTWNNSDDIYYQLKWQKIPEEKRIAFKKAMESEDEIDIDGYSIKLGSHRIMDKYTPFNFTLELLKLPCLSEIICEKWHNDLLEFLKESPFIYELTLINHNQKKLDFRGTSITKLMLDMRGLEELWLGEEVEQLLFQNEELDNCVIHAPNNGEELMIQFIGNYQSHKELSNLKTLHGINIKSFDMIELPDIHSHLKELRLWGKPGNIKNFSSLKEFKELEIFSTYDLFGFTKEDIPTPEELPKLNWFWLTSFPEEVAKTVKNLWKKNPRISLRITKPRKSEWLAQNLDNPFRTWDGAEHIPVSSAKKAVEQYRKTRSALLKIANDTEEEREEKALEIVTNYTQTFNKMRFIETEERDEIYTALCNILDILPDNINKDKLLDRFEELRDF